MELRQLSAESVETGEGEREREEAIEEGDQRLHPKTSTFLLFQM
jgi:hypothetical protein